MEKQELFGEIGNLYYSLEEQIKNQEQLDTDNEVLNETLRELQYHTRLMLNKRINEYAEKYGQKDIKEFSKYYV